MQYWTFVKLKHQQQQKRGWFLNEDIKSTAN